MACYPGFKAIIKGNDTKKYKEFKKYIKIFPSLSKLDIEYTDKLNNEVVINGETKWSLWFNSKIYISFSKLFNLEIKLFSYNHELYYKEFLYLNNGKVNNFDRKIYDNDEMFFSDEPYFDCVEKSKDELVKKGQDLLNKDLEILGVKGEEGMVAIYFFTMMLTTTRDFLNCPRPERFVNDSFISNIIDQEKFKNGIDLILSGKRDWDNYLSESVPEEDKEEVNPYTDMDVSDLPF